MRNRRDVVVVVVCRVCHRRRDCDPSTVHGRVVGISSCVFCCSPYRAVCDDDDVVSFDLWRNVYGDAFYDGCLVLWIWICSSSTRCGCDYGCDGGGGCGGYCSFSCVFCDGHADCCRVCLWNHRRHSPWIGIEISTESLIALMLVSYRPVCDRYRHRCDRHRRCPNRPLPIAVCAALPRGDFFLVRPLRAGDDVGHRHRRYCRRFFPWSFRVAVVGIVGIA
mmetsp:Transcript_24535/g.53078  ORF Transcript_24535/g.53078 Transcript_24535/m.53078 type:complete len:221 (+) Transcript_24535:671-1333(+)